MNRDEKTAVVDELAGALAEASAVLAVDYRGISVGRASELRGRLRESDANLRVVKNRLAGRAAERAGVESLKTCLTGPTALTFVGGDPAAAAKALLEFAGEDDPIRFKGGFVAGTFLSAGDVESLAKLPSSDVLIAQLAGTVASPLTGLARGLNGLLSGLAQALGQLQTQKASEGA